MWWRGQNPLSVLCVIPWQMQALLSFAESLKRDAVATYVSSVAGQ